MSVLRPPFAFRTRRLVPVTRVVVRARARVYAEIAGRYRTSAAGGPTYAVEGRADEAWPRCGGPGGLEKRKWRCLARSE